MPNIRKNLTAKALATLAFLPIAGVSTLACGTQYIPLFDAQVVTPSHFFIPKLSDAYVFASKTVTAYCDAPSVAMIKTDNGDGTYGPPIVDNYITAGNDSVSACAGGAAFDPLGLISGTNCFRNGHVLPVGGPIQATFDSTGVTAPVPLSAGATTIEYKLWDYGGVLGNTKLVLEIPASCSTINEWCSPGYWKNHPMAWLPLVPSIVPTTTFNGAYKYDPRKRACQSLAIPPSLWDVVNNPQCFGGEAANAVADMLSAAHPNVDFFGVRVEGSCPLN